MGYSLLFMSLISPTLFVVSQGTRNLWSLPQMGGHLMWANHDDHFICIPTLAGSSMCSTGASKSHFLRQFRGNVWCALTPCKRRSMYETPLVMQLHEPHNYLL